MSAGRGSQSLGLQSGAGDPEDEQTSAVRRALPRPLYPSSGLYSLISVLLEQPELRGVLGLAVSSQEIRHGNHFAEARAIAPVAAVQNHFNLAKRYR